MNTTNLTIDQRDLYGFLADRLRWFRGLTPMPAADVAAVLERVAPEIRERADEQEEAWTNT